MTQILKQGIQLGELYEISLSCSGRADVVASKPTSVKKKTPKGQTQASKGQVARSCSLVLIFLQLPASYSFFAKALGLSDDEIHALLLPIYNDKIDHKISAKMIDDARERRYISLFD